MILHSFFWMIPSEMTECSETSAHKTPTLGKTTFAVQQKFEIREVK